MITKTFGQSLPGFGRGRGVARGHARARLQHGWLDLFFALYCASIIIGAGILGLPVLVARLGLLPSLTLTAALGLLLSRVYVRIARTVHAFAAEQVRECFAAGAPALVRAGVNADALPTFVHSIVPMQARRKDVGLLDELSTWLGLRRAGTVALALGLLFYVVPACIGYMTAGGKTLLAIAQLAMLRGLSPAPFLLLALLLAAGSVAAARLRSFAGQAALCAIVQMAASWLGAVGLLMVSGVGQPWPVILFALANAGLVVRAMPEAEGAVRGPLVPAHLVGVVIAVTELLLLAVTAGIALILLGRLGQTHLPALLVSGVQPGDFANAFGLLLFAYTGTGIFNLIRYPQLFSHSGGEQRLPRVVALGTLVPALAYLGWMLVIATCLSSSTLLAADRATSYPTIPLGDLVSRDGGAGWLVSGTGYFVALLAVTGACSGFSESLANRLARLQQARRRGIPTSQAPATARVRQAQLGVLAGAALFTCVLPQMQFSTLLQVAGTAGGGLLLLVLPLFWPADGGRHAPGRDVVLATLIVVALVAMNLSALPAGMGHAVGPTCIWMAIMAINLGLVGAHAFLVRNWWSARHLAMPVAPPSALFPDHAA